MKPKIQITFHWEWVDKKGRLHKSRKKVCRSYVRAIIDMLNGIASDGNWKATPDVTNTAYSGAITSANTENAGAGITTHGIRVGTSTQAVVIGDYALIAPIAHGDGSGQLNHGACSVGTPATIGSSRQYILSRTLTNNSGADITVEEVGIYHWMGSTKFCLIERSLSTHTINNGASATAVYTISVTV